MTLSSESLAPHYSEFLSVSPQRLLLTGHSHQAWPDVAREAVLRAYDDAVSHVDDKWGRVFEQADRVRQAIGARVGCAPSEIALGQNTHELFTRFLSALPLDQRPKIIVTDGEFHSVYRQLRAIDRPSGTSPLFSGFIEPVWVSAAPASTLAERLAAQIDDRCAAVVCSTVMFQSGALIPHLEGLAERCTQRGVRLFLDAYHSFNVVPFNLSSMSQGRVYLSGGGYKYAQWGEGACWMRVPTDDDARPRFTGWFSDFEHLHDQRDPSVPLRYGARGAERFAGSTFDPTSIYRAARVARFFDDEGMSVEALRALSLSQTESIINGLEGTLELISPRAAEARGGFVAFHAPRAHEWVTALRDRHLFVDARGDALRFGPAPYLTKVDIERAIEAVIDVKRTREA